MPTEHFCTLFDQKFLPAGLCLHESLERNSVPYHLWILCIDKTVESQLSALRLPNVTLLTLDSVETESLLRVKPGRTIGEYCWTLTPFLPTFVFNRGPEVDRVTYLDADLYLFRSAGEIFQEFSASGAHALITEHAFDPRYDKSAVAGRFCVQFMTFRRTPEAQKILAWWQDRCIEWCYSEPADGKFGDQKYLDQWPALFGSEVHILQQKRLALAPWNTELFLAREAWEFSPVFFHFHGLRLINTRFARLFSGYHVGKRSRRLYDEYVAALTRAAGRLQAAGIALPYFPESGSFRNRLRNLRMFFQGRTSVARIAGGESR